jgi:5-carboxymethyl-2-hydroxymuconate isomerase
MPHITLEYSTNLPDVPDLAAAFGALHAALAPLGPFAIDDFKSRAHPTAAYAVGDGAKNRAYAHLTVGVFDRRAVDVQQRVADAALAWLEATFAGRLTVVDADLTVEVREMRAALYRKTRSRPTPSEGAP